MIGDQSHRFVVWVATHRCDTGATKNEGAEAEAVRRAWEKVHAENVTRDAIKGGMKALAAYQKYGVL